MINSERLEQTELKLKGFVNQSLPVPCVCARQFPASWIWFWQSEQLSELQQMLILFLEPRELIITTDTWLSCFSTSWLLVPWVLFSYSLQLSAPSAQKRMRSRPLSLPLESLQSLPLQWSPAHKLSTKPAKLYLPITLEFKHLTVRCQRANPPAKSKKVLAQAFLQWLMLFPVTDKGGLVIWDLKKPTQRWVLVFCFILLFNYLTVGKTVIKN